MYIHDEQQTPQQTQQQTQPLQKVAVDHSTAVHTYAAMEALSLKRRSSFRWEQLHMYVSGEEGEETNGTGMLH